MVKPKRTIKVRLFGIFLFICYSSFTALKPLDASTEDILIQLSFVYVMLCVSEQESYCKSLIMESYCNITQASHIAPIIAL